MSLLVTGVIVHRVSVVSPGGLTLASCGKLLYRSYFKPFFLCTTKKDDNIR